MMPLKEQCDREGYPSHKLYYWSVKNKAVELKAFDRLLLILDGMNGVQSDQFRMQCALQRMVPPPTGTSFDQQPRELSRSGRELHTVSGSPFGPNKTILVLRDAGRVMVGGAGIMDVLGKCENFKGQMTMLIEGTTVEMGDFQVGLGTVLLRPGEVFLGVVLDISYKPVSDHRLAEPVILELGAVLQEAVQALGGSLTPLEGTAMDAESSAVGRHALHLVRLMRQIQT